MIPRVTPGNGAAVEAEHPTRAWREVLRQAGAEKRAVGLSGAKLFGLDNPAVAGIVQALPNAARCQHFEAWLGPRPEVLPLVRTSHSSAFLSFHPS